jgi:phospho-N-acetylmuramoyl-pentapeptide-transferase
MFYHLAQALVPNFNAMNVLTYHTVRAGGAALTAFLFSLIVGPTIIRLLRSLKIGQYIKKEHVADLHALHKGKAGTPTMGGALILSSTIVALLLWSTLTNRLMWLCVMVFLLLGAVGFLDDFVKLRRKHNTGLSARA